MKASLAVSRRWPNSVRWPSFRRPRRSLRCSRPSCWATRPHDEPIVSMRSDEVTPRHDSVFSRRRCRGAPLLRDTPARRNANQSSAVLIGGILVLATDPDEASHDHANNARPGRHGRARVPARRRHGVCRERGLGQFGRQQSRRGLPARSGRRQVSKTERVPGSHRDARAHRGCGTCRHAWRPALRRRRRTLRRAAEGGRHHGEHE